MLFVLPVINSRGYADTTPNWTYTGSMNVARARFATALLQNGKILVAGGVNNLGRLSSAEIYDPTSGSWTMTGNMSTARSEYMAVTLANGKVLVAGGVGRNSANDILSSAELYDPATGIWTNTGSMNDKRAGTIAIVLKDGRVLIAGGGNELNILSSAEIYDPSTGIWTLTGSMNETRGSFTATLLNDGRVLVSGGKPDGSGPIFTSSEIYDPNTGTWTYTGSMNDSRELFTATRLADGRVLATGGVDDSADRLATSELYDPTTGIWTLTGSLSNVRYNHTSTLLSNGNVLITGGNKGRGLLDDNPDLPLTIAELYDPIAGTWSLTTPMNDPRSIHNTVLLSNGKVLAIGGFKDNHGLTLASSELYTPSVPSPTPTPTQVPHDQPTTTATIAPSPLANGEYPNPVTVTLSASAPAGFTVAHTYYQIDAAAQQTYSVPFTVSGAGVHTVTFWSVDNTGLEETPHKTQSFTINTNATDGQVSPGQTTPVTVGNISFTFGGVTDGGYVTIVPSSNNQGGPVPGKYKILNTFYEISTTATYTGPITVTINYNGQNAHQNLKLLHYDGTNWQDITQSSTLIDPSNNTYALTGSSPSLSPFAIVEENRQLTALSPAKVWVGLSSVLGAGVKFDLKAELYKDTTLVSTGQLNSFDPGLGLFGFGNLATISFNSFSPVDFPQGSKLNVKVYERTACNSVPNLFSSARLWYNDNQVNSRFGATLGTNASTYYLLNNFILSPTVGSGPKKTVDVSGGNPCSAFKPFGTWITTP